MASEASPAIKGLLTAADLTANKLPYALIADNSAGLLFAYGCVDIVITGADRIAANGDTGTS